MPTDDKDAATCAVDGCTAPRYQRRRLCGAHHARKVRYGDPTFVPDRSRVAIDLTGQRFGTLVVTGYDRVEHKWSCQCDCGATAFRATGCLNRYRHATTCGNRRRHRRRANAGYGAAHDRVRRDRGPASEHTCAACRRNRAHQWAYDHSDSNERVDPQLGPYSLDPARYRPLCVSCHKLADLARRSHNDDQRPLWT